MTENSTRTNRYETIFDDVMALYVALQSSHSVRVRRAKLNLRGEVEAEPIDFICDVDIKVKRAGFCVNTLLLAHTLPTVKRIIGKAFIAGNLHLDGPYKTLYFRVKNQAERNSMVSNEVALVGATVTGGE